MQKEKIETVMLSKRMAAVANMVTKGSRTADIGCDHGFVSIYLMEQHICLNVLAMDINEGPLEGAREHIAKRNLSKYIEVRQSDGAKALTFLHHEDGSRELEVDSMIAAGIGGRLMIKIIEESMDKIASMKEIILQPQSEIVKVRHFLTQNHFFIVNEDMVYEEGKYYQIIKVIPSKTGITKLSEKEEWFGPVLIQKKHPVLCQYLINEKKKYEEIKTHICNHAKDMDTREETLSSVSGRLQMINQTLALL